MSYVTSSYVICHIISPHDTHQEWDTERGVFVGQYTSEGEKDFGTTSFLSSLLPTLGERKRVRGGGEAVRERE